MNTIVDRTASIEAIRRIAAIIGIAAFFSGFGEAGAADAPQPRWLLSTRAAPQYGDLSDGASHFRCWRLEEGKWAPQETPQCCPTDASAGPTIVFVHGNRTDADEAVAQGLAMHQAIRQQVSERPFQFIIWSWPSERDIKHVRAEMQQRLWDCDVQSYYLAEWLAARKADTPICLIGYSFGSRIITGALHLTAGGALAGRSLPANQTEGEADKKPLRVVLLAAAVDSAAVAGGRRNGQALSLVDQMLVTENTCDRVLRWDPRIWKGGGPQAMGFVGPALNDGKDKVKLIDVCCEVGDRHDIYAYMASGAVRSRLAHYAFLEDE
jgi:hypothetical protein